MCLAQTIFNYDVEENVYMVSTLLNMFIVKVEYIECEYYGYHYINELYHLADGSSICFDDISGFCSELNER